jgi:hypothetical protein
LAVLSFLPDATVKQPNREGAKIAKNFVSGFDWKPSQNSPEPHRIPWNRIFETGSNLFPWLQRFFDLSRHS